MKPFLCTWIKSGLFLLILPIAARADVTFRGDWADFGAEFQKSGPQTKMVGSTPVEFVAGWGHDHWRMVQEMGPDRIVIEQDPTSPGGGAVARIEVRPGDNLGHAGSSERTEVSHMLGKDGKHLDVLPSPLHDFYGLSVKLDSKWHRPSPLGAWTWGIFFQLHSPDDYSSPPAFALAAEDDFHVNFDAGDNLDGGKLRHNRDGVSYPFIHGDLNLGHWVEFMIDAVWSYEKTGSITIYRRDEGEKEFKIVFQKTNIYTLQSRFNVPNDEKFHYWKAGYYRSGGDMTNRLWLGRIVRGTNFDEVALAAFGKS